MVESFEGSVEDRAQIACAADVEAKVSGFGDECERWKASRVELGGSEDVDDDVACTLLLRGGGAGA